MPLTSNVSKNIKELYADNKKLGKARGANGKPRNRAQIVAIAMSAARKAGGCIDCKANKTHSHQYQNA